GRVGSHGPDRRDTLQGEQPAAYRAQHSPPWSGGGRDPRRTRGDAREMSSIQNIMKEARAHMEKALENSKHEFASIRSGKASPNMLDTVRVEMYGAQMTLNQVASIASPEPRLLIVTPFDKGQIKIVEKAIRESDLGLEPSTQGGIIRVPLPAMNEQ